MKIIIKNNGVIYNDLNTSILKNHMSAASGLIALVRDDRKLGFDENHFFIDDITQEELNKGLEAVKEVLLSADEIELLKEYFAMFCEVSSEEAKLQYAKEFKKYEIDKAKNEAIEGGVSFKNKIFQSAERDRNLLTSTVSLFAITKQLPEGFVWISKDNEAVPFTLEELTQLGGLMANSVNINTIKARNLKDKIEQALSVEEVENIKWSE
ncbi:DUF4376 domain-containing protein [Campylobacter sp. VTCC 70190]|uniref:DUF4376 domain-containing protein n=1 Tax=Campylobacter sp. VTCC 70190 TaxID=3392118 RepID=UPI00398ED06F